ncbi:WbuC family cupin fold metalloprotein [Providencia huaxiensis]|uniref:WbuC family cupin fold metalloprotein n=1 Tax=Providencia TaxID=586 RepID=UPI001B39A59E|nr:MULTISPECIES: WbuC family cupin fold metalloprotein [Providencia]EMB8479483.1 WbuC family cupin fold metalloprotein [Providencia rettgeri]MBQ0687722.1 WbuC family cupin fold metalloprotein [Providencia rettgeri]MCB4855705.1 WbuC family cupin fold metalloprotein [Providencia rettgeri]MCD6316662.1 WbuC family cupin fold metalloprotein [Providencia rettgeri]MCG9536226.1 WbuC family cupin fold metalloprotein [Providencia huaxiensis]
MNLIDTEIIEKIYIEAKNSPRKRSHYLLHKSHQDKVQRLLIALVSGSYIEPHYHELDHQWEMFFILEGTLEINIHDSKGSKVRTKIIGDNTQFKAVEIKPNEIHSLKCLSKKALILEIKEGPFNHNNPKILLNYPTKKS